jgi:hypothetical protein
VNLDAATALAWVARATALGLVVQSVELWIIRDRVTDHGVWCWPVLRPEHDSLPFPLRWLFRLLLPYRPFIALVVLRALSAGWMLATSSIALAPLLLLAQVAICVRFRGTFNGGSDYMSVVLLLALSLACAPALTRAALAYIAVQTTLSYCIAGLVKIKSRQWRDGEALRRFLALAAERHGAPRSLTDPLAAPRRAQLLALAIIGFECTFPLAWLDPRACVAYLAIGLGFHLANDVVFGLNRFFFAWAAAYPAVLFCSQLLGSSA